MMQKGWEWARGIGKNKKGREKLIKGWETKEGDKEWKMIKTGEMLAVGALLCHWKLEPQGRTVICSSCFNLAVCTQDSSPSIGRELRGYHVAGRLSVAGLSFVIREKCRLACFLLPLPCSQAEGCLQVSTDKWWEPHTHTNTSIDTHLIGRVWFH